MSSSEFFWTSSAILLLGILTGWGLFSTPQLGRALVLDNGNLADWMAAGGTWVIGYGAWKYARASHEHHVRQALRAEFKDLQAAHLKLGNIYRITARANGPHLAFIEFESRKIDWTVALPKFVKQTAGILRALRWELPDADLLDDATNKQFGLCEIECDTYEMVADDFLERYDGKKLTAAEATKHVAEFKKIAADLAAASGRVTDFVTKKRDRLGKRMTALSLRLRVR